MEAHPTREYQNKLKVTRHVEASGKPSVVELWGPTLPENTKKIKGDETCGGRLGNCPVYPVLNRALDPFHYFLKARNNVRKSVNTNVRLDNVCI